MVSSLKAKYTTPLELIIGSTEFVKIFTDAANHIPRHRRMQYVIILVALVFSFLTKRIISSFFTHLVDVLGAESFLAPVCVLIIGKAANKVVRQHGEDLKSTLALPLSVLHHYPADVQLSVSGCNFLTSIAP